MKVLITQHIGRPAVYELERVGIFPIYNDSTTPWSEAQLLDEVREVEAIVCLLTDKISAAVMDAAPRLRLIANVAVGYDNIDLAAATQRGIVVTNTPDVLTETTADLAFALLLALARRIPQADAYMRDGRYTHFELFPEMIGQDVYGKTLGIVGMGRIGTAVARRAALGFGMKVIYASRSAKPELIQTLGAAHVAFPDLLQESDFISIHLPLTPHTRHLFTENEFLQMRGSASIINTARGPIIKEDDLVEALRRGIIRGAALDVFEHEPQMHPALVEMKDRVVVAPHVGSATTETRLKMARMAVANVLAAQAGECPPNALNGQVWGGQ